jgi:hypothetical protein
MRRLAMNYRIANISDDYAFYWIDSQGKTNTIYAKGVTFSLSELLKIINENPQYLFNLGNNNGIEISQVDNKGKVVKHLRREDFEIKVAIKA